MTNTLTFEQSAALQKWNQLKTQRAVIVEQEKQARKEVLDLFFPTKTVGTQRVEIGNGYRLKLVHKINYKINQEKIEQALDQIEATGNEGKFVAERITKVTHELSVSEYKKLAEPYKKIIDTVLETKDVSPEMEIEAPKGR